MDDVLAFGSIDAATPQLVFDLTQYAPYPSYRIDFVNLHQSVGRNRWQLSADAGATWLSGSKYREAIELLSDKDGVDIGKGTSTYGHFWTEDIGGLGGWPPDRLDGSVTIVSPLETDTNTRVHLDLHTGDDNIGQSGAPNHVYGSRVEATYIDIMAHNAIKFFLFDTNPTAPWPYPGPRANFLSGKYRLVGLGGW